MLTIRRNRIDIMCLSNLCAQCDNADCTEEKAEQNEESPRNVANGAPGQGRDCCLY